MEIDRRSRGAKDGEIHHPLYMPSKFLDHKTSVKSRNDGSNIFDKLYPDTNESKKKRKKDQLQRILNYILCRIRCFLFPLSVVVVVDVRLKPLGIKTAANNFH